MTKTQLTKEIEVALFKAVKADGLGVYGCLEVSFGSGYGDQYCDFVTMDADNVFRCYINDNLRGIKNDRSKKQVVRRPDFY